MGKREERNLDLSRSDFFAMCIAAYQAMAPILLVPLLVLVLFYVLVMLW